MDERNNRRGKPQQQIYRPGSGPLRKSNTGLEESESDTNLIINSRQSQGRNAGSHDDTWRKSEGNSPRNRVSDIEPLSNNFGDMTFKEVSRKSKKPEQPIYVPPHAQPRDRNDSFHDNSVNEKSNTHHFNGEERSSNNDRYIHNERYGNNDRYAGNDRYTNNERYNNRSKRYSNRRRTSDDRQNEWREKSPSVPRQVRQGSEPRGSLNNTNWQRSRDTRSVEPSNLNYNDSKINSKPPSGRRHSTIGLESDKRFKQHNLDNLPPRLKKKLLAENKFLNQTPAEDIWDGASITFQGSLNPIPDNLGTNKPYMNYATLPTGQLYHNQNQQESIYCTMKRPRGRGRLQNDYMYNEVGSTYFPETPDRMYSSPCNSRPPTPPPSCSYRTRSIDNSNHDSRPQTPVNYQRNDYHRYNNNNNQRYPEDRYNRNHPEDRYRRQDKDRRSEERFNDRNYDRNKYRNTDYQEQDLRAKLNNKKSERELHSRPQSAINNSLELQLSPVSPATPEEKKSDPIHPVPDLGDNNADNTVWDWSEEVELNDRLESEALSDAITRSSSVASLVETSTRSMPSTTNNSSKKSKWKNKKRNKKRSGSKPREQSPDNSRSSQPPLSRQNSHSTADGRDNKDSFKVPEEPHRHRRRRNSRNRRDSSFDRFHNKSRTRSRESSFERMRRSSTSEHENWREECNKIPDTRQCPEPGKNSFRSRNNSERSRTNSEREDVKGLDVHKGGILVLPQKTNENVSNVPASQRDRPKYPEVTKPISSHQKSLFDPNNPNKPIIVKAQSTRVSVPGFSDNAENSPPQVHYYTDQYGNVGPSWYDETCEGFKACHFKDMVRDIKKADTELQFILNRGLLLLNWGNVENLRHFLREALEYLLCKDLKFCQAENVEQHLWKLIYHNIIEITRKAITTDVANKEQYKGFLLYVLDEGTKYFETLLERLEETYNFQLNTYIGNNHKVVPKGSSYLKLALISAQKILLFLGDLARYREQINETSNYGKCRQWYIKAQELNPKNGRPYNQLAVVAVYSRRKLDAVYFYMRSLMSSNPFPSAKESLGSLFDEIRKKYEQGERKRREERLERARQHMKQKESEDSSHPASSLRREIWIRPDGGRRVHRTTQAVQEEKDSEEEDLAALSSVEVNKRFVISYLHVHGKLITRIGMESFHEAAMQMLKEFRALLQHSPVPLPCNRFLQLLALNMFSIEHNQLKDPQLQLQSGYRSELQERALVVSLQMFNMILERCVALIQEHISTNRDCINSLPQDAHVLLPAIKIWCDWLLCHSSVWNPPPSTQDFKVGSPGDAWSRLAILMNLLKQLDRSSPSFPVFVEDEGDDYELVKLPEDNVLSGFTPLMCNVQKPAYVSKDIDPEIAQFALRLNKLLFFGTEFLCGLEPPVLKLEIEDDFREYVSVVNTSSSLDSPPSPRELVTSEDVLESFSSEEEEDTDEKVEDAPQEIRDLLNRKNELEKRHKRQELHIKRVKKILSQSVVSVLIEVRPKYLVPDTNCFIDHLDRIATIASSHVYTLMVPIVVLSELEGLARGGKSPTPAPRSSLDPQHLLKVAELAKKALEFLKCRPPAVKCITTRGAILSSTTFTTEDDSTLDANIKNDDKILVTCLILCKGQKDATVVEGEPRKLVQEVVLLTDDRNLRVKALARDVPVRELPDFIQWAGLG